jgi:hypothetical protein
MVDTRMLKSSHSPTYCIPLSLLWSISCSPLKIIIINKEYHALITNTFICKRLYTLEGTHGSSRKIMM